jgi:hypothetical protein
VVGCWSRPRLYHDEHQDGKLRRVGPREHLNSLLGLWVQRDTQGRLLVSPLVKPFAERELAPETLRACHQVLAERIVQQRALTQLDAASAIVHFHSAGYAQRAGTILLSFLSELLKLDITGPICPSPKKWSLVPRSFSEASRWQRGVSAGSTSNI